ncbi:MAG: hypothetical protein R2729_24435 [Bryobacteraceae bacterium]
MAIRRDSNRSRLVVLAPASMGSDPTFGFVTRDGPSREQWLRDVQRFRGRIYCEDGAINSGELSFDGRHIQSEDIHSWHVVGVDAEGEIIGCARYRAFGGSPRLHDLSAGRSELARSPQWNPVLAASLEQSVREVEDRGIVLAEVGGWAVTEAYRCRAEALRLALSTFALSRLLGGCIAYTTATVRHCSASILRRLGGQSVVVGEKELPRYFDPKYDCEMEILRFDSEQPSPRYASVLDLLCSDLAAAEIVAAPALPVRIPVTPMVPAYGYRLLAAS